MIPPNRGKANIKIAVVVAVVTLVAFAVIGGGKHVVIPGLVHVEAGGPALVDASKLAPFQRKVVADLDRQMNAGIVYHDGYYIGGDPPPKIGVCSDVVVRSYRAAGVDLQNDVQRDIRANRNGYDVVKPDRNIDHRRCRNLAVYFKRHAKTLAYLADGKQLASRRYRRFRPAEQRLCRPYRGDRQCDRPKWQPAHRSPLAR